MTSRFIVIVTALSLSIATGPESPQTAETAVATGAFHLARGNHEAALTAFLDVIQRNENAEYTADALIGATKTYLRFNRVELAWDALQQVIRRFPGRVQSEVARQANTVLYRLYLSRKLTLVEDFQKPTLSVGRTSGLAVDSVGRLTLAGERGWVRWSADGQRQDVYKALPGEYSITALGLKPDGARAFARGFFMSMEESQPGSWQPDIPKSDKDLNNVSKADIKALVWQGDWVIADGSSEAIFRRAAGQARAVRVVSVRADKLAVDYAGNIAALDRRSKKLSIVKWSGDVAGVDASGRLANADDLAFDSVGYLYVLDSQGAQVHVFNPQFNWLVSLTLPHSNKESRARPTALSVDATGRLLTYDVGVETIRGYR